MVRAKDIPLLIGLSRGNFHSAQFFISQSLDELIIVIEDLIKSLNQDDNDDQKDGMDISICKSKFYRKGNDERPTLNKGFFKEYETYIHDIFGKSVEIKGPPIASKDPRDDFAGCLEKTLRNKARK